MAINVTQSFTVRVMPVNMPNKTNRYGEQLGFYRAYVAGGKVEDIESAFLVAEHEARRGIISELVGYGQGATPQSAATNAIVDYAAKFGPLCLVNGKESA